MSRIADIAHRLNEQAEAYAAQILGHKPMRRGREARFGDNGALRVWLTGPKIGKWTNFVDGSHGDMLDLTMVTLGMTREAAIDHARSWLGLSNDPLINRPELDRDQIRKAAEAEAQAEILRKQQIARAIWKKSQFPSEHAWGYLGNRGLVRNDPAWMREKILTDAELRFMRIDPSVANGQPVVSVVFGATNSDGQLCAVQQVLTAGGKKLSVDIPKKTNGALRGSAVRMDPVDDIVVLAEGPETALSIRQSTNLPTWITLGTANAVNIALPEGVRHVILAVDLEPSGSGLAAALRAAYHFERQGRTVSLAIPDALFDDAKTDFNDVLQHHGPTAVAKAFPGWTTQAPGSLKACVCTDARNGLAAWILQGGDVRLARVQQEFRIVADTHLPEDAASILMIAEAFPDCQDWQRRHPSVQLDRLVMPPHRLLRQVLLDRQEGTQQAKRLVQADGQHNVRSLYCPEIKQGKIVLCQNRLSADALIGYEGWVGMAWDTSVAPQYWDWAPLAGQEVVLAPNYSEAGWRAASDTIPTLIALACRIKIVNWIGPEGGTLPVRYDLAQAVTQGWTGTRLTEGLLALAVPVWGLQDRNPCSTAG